MVTSPSTYTDCLDNAALAYTLGKDGRRVHVIERDLSEPDRIVGESVQPGGYLKLLEWGLEDCVDEIDAQRVFGYALYKDEKTPSLSYPLENFDSNVYGRSFQGNIDRARNVIEFMKNDGCCPNSALVDGLCKAGKPEDAKGVLAEMKNFVLKPDTVTYTSLINFFCRNGQIDEATKLLKEMKENECEADTVTFNVILGGLSREGRFDEALDMIEKLPRQGVYLNKGSYRIVLNSLTQKCELRKVNKLLGLMLSRGFVPHYATSNELLVRPCKDGLADDAATTLFDLVDMGFQPQLDSWELLIELICRDRKLFFGLESGEENTSQILLQALLEILNSTEPHYIRCVKPNNLLKPTIFSFLAQQCFAATAPWRCHGGNQDKLCWLSHKKTFDEFVDRFGLLAPEVLDHSSDKKSKENGKGVQSVANLTSYPLKSSQEQNFTIPVQPVNFSYKPGATSDTVAETVSSHKLNNGRNGLGFVRQPVMDWGVGVTIERKVDLIHF
ncbi:hypothetical protein KIW84_053965 [Lathyrus oleraceus]|uniref:Pentatricopeptide repeat-containing protein n=1 Tax=Pisum sativum TaxID=3888 RepID=A0A9D5AHN5_PEA|nr:hypothetical protein KIW84_053965 [Pisum sativum]